MIETTDFKRVLMAYTRLADAVLQTKLLHLNRQLVFDEGLDYTMVPQPVRHSYEELFFGGALFDCQPFRACEIRTTFHVFFSAMQLNREQGFILLGPYLAEDAPLTELDELLAQNGVALTEKNTYLHYLQTLPVLPQHKIKAMLNTLTLQLNASEVTTLYRGPDLTAGNHAPCPVFEEDSAQARADLLERRYQREHDFLVAVAQGDLRVAQVFCLIDLNRLPNKLRNDKNQLIIMNTLLRKAIETSKVHPYYIDQISAKWAVRIENAATMNDINLVPMEMIEDYCMMVQRHSLANYSSAVRSMINFVNFNLSNSALSLQMIATTLNASPSYLSRIFNKEVAKSLPEYIKDQRISQAKQLLAQGDSLSIAQISAAVGFADTNYFTKVFRQCTGVTPTMFRSNPSAVGAQE